MTDLQSAMKPQEQIIYILGQLQGQFSSLQQSVETASTAQAAVNASNEAEHAEFRRELAAHGSEIAVIKSNTAPRAPWWNVASGLAAVAALILAALTLFSP